VADGVPGFGEVKLSTPLIFDIGVYLVVLGSVMTIIALAKLAEAEE
jgi:multicomponent Na+:H+ antiporter subunit B